MIITKTPYRLSLFGGGTDYNVWFEKKRGLVIASAFSRYCYITVRSLPPFFDHKSRIVYSKTEDVKNNSNIKHPAVNACLRHLEIDDGLEIHHDGDLPARSGIGSSSSFTVGLLMALHAYKHRMITKEKLAREAIHVEQNVAKENVGVQDQIMAAYGGLQIIEMGPGPDFNVRPLIFHKDYRDYLESHILLGFTGLTRFASNTAADKIKNIQNGSTDSYLSEIYTMAQEGLTALTRESDMSVVGKLMDATWQLKKNLSTSVTNEQMDTTYQKALNSGALGGRLLGAGAGGFFVFLAPPHRHEKIKQELKEIKVWVPFSFDYQGSQVILYDDN
jgi:D-glycero-alpha-D-manno-heptose-7-phosphate kinase